MLNALKLIPEVGRRERRVHTLVARAEHDRHVLRRAAHEFAARLAREIQGPRGLGASFAAGCILGSRAAGPIVALAFAVGRHLVKVAEESRQRPQG